MIRKLVLSILAVVLLAACTPGVQKVLPQYAGKAGIERPHVEIREFDLWAQKCAGEECTLYTTTKLRVHNPLKRSFRLRTKCEYIIGDYTDSTIRSKWFWIGAKESVVITPFQNIITIFYYQNSESLKAVCQIEYEDKADAKEYSQGVFTFAKSLRIFRKE